MGFLLTSEEYKKYFDKLANNVILDHNKLLKYMNEAIRSISGVVHIGRVDVQITAPPNPFEHTPQTGKETLFQDDRNYDEKPIEKRYESGDRGRVIVTIYPTKGHEWDSDELREIDLISRSTYVFMNYSRLLGLMDKLSCTDVQTNMPNYAAVAQIGGMLAARGELKNYTGVFLNIKNFKFVNKAASAKCGDLCLSNYGHMLMDFVGHNGIVGRLGGDNFIVIIHDSIAEDFIKFASCISINCEMPDRTYKFNLEARMGVYKVRESDTMSELMNCSSIAFSFARRKQIGNIEYFRDYMLQETIHSKEISAVFPQALADGEFTVYYQPIVGTVDNTICGCEALARWVRGGKLVPPIEFIPTLEDEGSVCQLDFYVLESVCKAIRSWIDNGIEPVKVSVNFSKLHLHNADLVERILQVVKRYDIDTRYIEIELTETSGYKDYEALHNFVDAMKKNGISTAIDDFGVGYSSMNLLASLNVDIIKLDKSFFDSRDNSLKYRTMTKSVVNMVKELGMRTIAEGVETAELKNYLNQIGCDMIQGYYYDKPLTLDAFEDKLKTKKCYQE